MPKTDVTDTAGDRRESEHDVSESGKCGFPTLLPQKFCSITSQSGKPCEIHHDKPYPAWYLEQISAFASAGECTELPDLDNDAVAAFTGFAAALAPLGGIRFGHGPGGRWAATTNALLEVIDVEGAKTIVGDGRTPEQALGDLLAGIGAEVDAGAPVVVADASTRRVAHTADGFVLVDEVPGLVPQAVGESWAPLYGLDSYSGDQPVLDGLIECLADVLPSGAYFRLDTDGGSPTFVLEPSPPLVARLGGEESPLIGRGASPLQSAESLTAALDETFAAGGEVLSGGAPVVDVDGRFRVAASVQTR